MSQPEPIHVLPDTADVLGPCDHCRAPDGPVAQVDFATLILVLCPACAARLRDALAEFAEPV
jgi:hypothetical protein